MGSVIAEPLVVRRPDACKSCGETTTELRRFTCSNRTYQVRYQCLACGGSVGNPIPHYQVDDLMRLPAWDVNRAVTLRIDREIERIDAKAAEQAAWRERYDRHIGSTKWRQIADRVLLRADYLCEGCLSARATQVHHLTYDHMGDEFMFELLALCKPCHERIHEVQA